MNRSTIGEVTEYEIIASDETTSETTTFKINNNGIKINNEATYTQVQTANQQLMTLSNLIYSDTRLTTEILTSEAIASEQTDTSLFKTTSIEYTRAKPTSPWVLDASVEIVMNISSDTANQDLPVLQGILFKQTAPTDSTYTIPIFTTGIRKFEDGTTHIVKVRIALQTAFSSYQESCNGFLNLIIDNKIYSLPMTITIT